METDHKSICGEAAKIENVNNFGWCCGVRLMLIITTENIYIRQTKVK